MVLRLTGIRKNIVGDIEYSGRGTREIEAPPAGTAANPPRPPDRLDKRGTTPYAVHECGSATLASMDASGLLALRPGRVPGWNYSRTVHDLGELKVPSGRLEASDPFVNLGQGARGDHPARQLPGAGDRRRRRGAGRQPPAGELPQRRARRGGGRAGGVSRPGRRQAAGRPRRVLRGAGGRRHRRIRRRGRPWRAACPRATGTATCSTPVATTPGSR